MTLRRRVHKLEATISKPARVGFSIWNEIIAPGASGPELVALIMRDYLGKDVKLVRKPEEDETTFRARFREACATA